MASKLVSEFVSIVRHELEKAEEHSLSEQWERAVDEMQTHLSSLQPEITEVIKKFCHPKVRRAVEEMEKHDPEGLEDILKDSAIYPAGQWDRADDADARQASFYEVKAKAFKMPLGSLGAATEMLNYLAGAMSPSELDEAVAKVLEDERLTWQVLSQRETWAANWTIKSTVPTNLAVYFYIDEEALLEAIEKIHGSEDIAENTVYTFADGFYACELSVAELRKEGREMGNCVARDDIGHPQAIADGSERIFSIRTPAGKPKFDVLYEVIQAWMPSGEFAIGEVWKVREVKGKGNRLPGFEPGKARVADFVKPDEVEKCSEFIMNYLGYTKEELHDIQDLLPGLLSLEEWKKARAEKEAKEKADKAAKRGTKNPGRQRAGRHRRRMPAKIPISREVARLANQVQRSERRVYGDA